MGEWPVKGHSPFSGSVELRSDQHVGAGPALADEEECAGSKQQAQSGHGRQIGLARHRDLVDGDVPPWSFDDNDNSGSSRVMVTVPSATAVLVLTVLRSAAVLV